MSPEEVLTNYFSEVSRPSFTPLGVGANNLTLKLSILDERGGKLDYVLQKLAKYFKPALMEDVEYITSYLEENGFPSQKVIRTTDGALYVKDRDTFWRLMTHIPGESFEAMPSSLLSEEAGRLVGKFQRILAPCDYQFKFKLPHYHDPDHTFKKLHQTLGENEGSEKYKKLQGIAEETLELFSRLPELPPLPQRIVHGDLKISNFLFEEGKARALVDLDTLMRHNVAIEFGDALRSWCLSGHEDTERIEFREDFYRRATAGYFSEAKFLTEEEKSSIPLGMKITTLDLTARFIIDAFEETYFVLFPERYKSLFEQNKKRAENQLAFFKEFSKFL